MTDPIAALPMYDWPETRAVVDAQWDRLRAALRGFGIEAPARLVRRNADLPAAPGGIRDAAGTLLAPDPSTLPPDELDLDALWLHPDLLFAQTCWGPMERGLAENVRLLGQPSYDGVDGGRGELYSSAILMRRSRSGHGQGEPPPADGRALLPLDRLHGVRFAYNGPDSMSGIIALTRDLAAVGESLGIFADRLMSGAHRASIVAVAQGRADLCAVDCRSWATALQHEPAARELQVVGWTARRKGLPYIMSRSLPELHAKMTAALSQAGMFESL